MSDHEPVSYEVDRRVARITLDRPQRGNGITRRLVSELERAVERADLDPAVHVMLLSGNGEGFCGGYDLGDVDVIADAADAAGLDSAAVVAAARNPSAFEPQSVGSTPMIQLGDEWFHGEDVVARAARAMRPASSWAADGSPVA